MKKKLLLSLSMLLFMGLMFYNLQQTTGFEETQTSDISAVELAFTPMLMHAEEGGGGGGSVSGYKMEEVDCWYVWWGCNQDRDQCEPKVGSTCDVSAQQFCYDVCG